MESSSASANSSFGSTASSSTSPSPSPSPSPPDAPREATATAGDDHVAAIKQEPASDAGADCERSDWAHFLDNGIICLDDDDPMDAADLAADPRRTADAGAAAARGADAFYHHPETTLHEPTPSSALLDTTNWGYYDADMMAPAASQDVSRTFESTMGLAPSTAAFFDSASGPHKSDVMMTRREHHTDGVLSSPMYTVAFEKQAHGQPFSLSKPLLRDDGVVVVGTERAVDGSSTASSGTTNCLFITRVGPQQQAHASHVIPTAADVRDLQWLANSAAVVAIGSDVHVLRLDANAKEVENRCSLTPPVRRIHADTIRELAVMHGGHEQPIMIASGGFDETVVLTKLGEGGDPATATMDRKINAQDVVSSLRWHPTETNILSWTTDGGDFQLTDVRARTTPRLQAALSSLVNIDSMGGLFCHEYISPSNVVLGFQSDQLLFLDLRMPRNQYCYGVMQSPLIYAGDIRRSATGACSIFGVGGFATAAVDSQGRELVNLTGVRPPHAAHIGLKEYKASGEFSYESNAFFAVSDSLGVVSVYNTDPGHAKPSSTAGQVTASDGDWQETTM